MAQLTGSDHILIKSENEARESVWSEEHDRIPLKQRLKMLLASEHLSDLGDTEIEEEITILSIPPIDITVKKENELCDSQVGAADGSWLQHRVLSKCPVKVDVQCTESNSVSLLGNYLNRSSNADLQVTKINVEIPDDFLDDLDHIVLKERQGMLLSRKLLGLTKSVEGNSSGLSSTVDDMIQQNAGIGKEESNFGGKECSMGGNHSHNIPDGNASVSCESGSSNGIVVGLSGTTPHPELVRHRQGTTSTKSGNSTNMHENNRICSSSEDSTNYDSYGGKSLLTGNHKTAMSSALPTFANVKVEPSDNKLQIPNKNDMGKSCFANLVPVKSELEITDELFGDKIDHMLLRERMKLLASREVPHSNVHGNLDYRKIVPSALGCRPVVSECSKSISMKRRRKRRKTATDSVETALEEDAPGLLQVLIDKGVFVDEIKLYGEMESDDVLDDSSNEDSFAELEDVISKIFSQRHSFLKFASMRCAKGEKASYCLACLISLVEQARYLQFRKWPVEWGWCRDLQSFIFVFERHNRIVLERPEYGYATYFFELVDSLPVHWQIKRLVTAMKLTSCSRVTLIENKALMVGDDLTEGEARVLTEYGWIPDSGLGTMLNYCDRVVHDRKNESDSSEWRSKIGKLLMDGYNGGTIVSTDIPKKVVEYGVVQGPRVKLEI